MMYLLSSWLGGFGNNGSSIDSLTNCTEGNLAKSITTLSARCSDILCSLIYNLHGPLLSATAADKIQALDSQKQSDSFGTLLPNHGAGNNNQELKKKLEATLKVHVCVLWHLEQATQFLGRWRERWRCISAAEFTDNSGTIVGGAAAPFMIPYLVGFDAKNSLRGVGH